MQSLHAGQTVKGLNIAHIGNTAGVANVLSSEHEKRGHKVTVFSFDDMLHRQFGGIMINYSARTAFRGEKKYHPFWMLERRKMYGMLEKSDIWHYHYPYGKLKRDIYGRRGKHRVLAHYHGDDVRNKRDDDFCLVATPDLLKFTPNGLWLPNPIDIAYVSQFRTQVRNERPKVAHYPHYRNYGTDLYRDFYSGALSSLQEKGAIELVHILRQTFENALKMMAQSDIVVGKILPDVGWFGKFELEAMALGKPVIAYVSDELYEKYRPPVYRTTKESFQQDLERLVGDEKAQRVLAQAGHSYVEENHDVRKVAARLERYYDVV